MGTTRDVGGAGAVGAGGPGGEEAVGQLPQLRPRVVKLTTEQRIEF